MRRHRLLIFLGYVGGALVIAVLLANVGPLFKYKPLAEGGVETAGTVVAPDCENHNTFRYRFSISGRDYEARGNFGIEKECRALVAGDPVHVWYLPDNPGVNISGEPRALLRNEIVSIAMASLLLPAFAIFGIGLRLRHRRGR